jgi:hypothetical protein
MGIARLTGNESFASLMLAGRFGIGNSTSQR